MSIRLTSDVEKERTITASKRREKPTWDLFRSLSIVQAVHFARDNGWKDRKVQVRVERVGTDIVQYVVEPYEKDCSCHGLLRYKDYYETEDE